MNALPNVKLRLPSLKYKDSFLAGMREFVLQKNRNFSERQYDAYVDIKSDEDFQRLVVQPKLDEMVGKGLKEGYVPATDFWVIKTNDNGEEAYVGRISLRHALTDNLRKVGGHVGYDVVPSKRGLGYAKTALRLVLEKAKKMGMPEVLITCDETNEPSKRTIIGVLKEYGGKEEEALESDHDVKKLRFWVNTSKS